GREADVSGAGPDARRGPGGGLGRAPDGGRDGPAGGGDDARERRDPLLVALARRPVAQGRDLRPHPARPGRLRRLRRGRAARAGPPGGRRVSHGAAYLLLHDPPGGRRPARVTAAREHARAARADDRDAEDEPAVGLVRRRAPRGGRGGQLPPDRRGGRPSPPRGARRRSRTAAQPRGGRTIVSKAGPTGPTAGATARRT